MTSSIIIFFVYEKNKKYFNVILLLFLSCTVSAQQSKLDLTQPDQQKDFLKYLRTTTSMFEDKSMKENVKGYRLKNLSDTDKQQIAIKMMKDTAYFKRLYDYFDFMKILESKYKISQFSNKEWEEVAQFGARNGIYFVQAMKKLKDQKDSFPHIPYYFPITPLKTSTDTIRSHSVLQKNLKSH